MMLRPDEVEVADSKRVDRHPGADRVASPGAEDRRRDQQGEPGAGVAPDEHIRRDVEQAHDDGEDQRRPDHAALAAVDGRSATGAGAAIRPPPRQRSPS